MKQLSIILLLGFLVFGCEPKLKPERPVNLIPKDQMTLVLYDMFVINSAKGIDRKIFETNNLNPETYILEKYSIDSLQFANSNDYYAHDIEVYSAIVDSIKARITTEKEKYEALSKEEELQKEKEKDSIRRVVRKLPVEKPSVNRVMGQD